MDCKLLDCDETATVRLMTPFGTGNFCAEHATIGEADEQGLRYVGCADAFRYGPIEDPPIDLERGPEFPRTQRRGPLVDVFGVAPGGLAMVRCPHGKWWPEGGFGCADCMPATMAAALEENLT